MSDEIDKIKILELKIESLTEKVNEVILCLEDNKLSRKVAVDYIYSEEEKKEETKEE